MHKYVCLSILTQGMVYLHKSVIQSHGSLTSFNCVIDNRWVLKITGHGLSAFKKERIAKTENEKFQDLLWTAPELVRMKHIPLGGTQKGDVYSFGIVFLEIITRAFPYSNYQLSFKGIAYAIKLIDGCSLELCSATPSVTFSHIRSSVRVVLISIPEQR